MIEDLYEKYRAELIRWCRRMTQNESAAEDLVQEAFYRALHHTQELDGMDLAQGRAWLYRTVKNLFVDRFRRERRESVIAELPEEARYTDYGELENAQLLSGLPEEERILFTMRYLEGYNSRELGSFSEYRRRRCVCGLLRQEDICRESGRIKGWRKRNVIC